MDTLKRRTLPKLFKSIGVLTKDLLTEQVNCQERNQIPVEFKAPGNWVRFPMFFSQARTVLHTSSPSRKPAAVRGQALLFRCFMEEEKNLWKH